MIWFCSRKSTDNAKKRRSRRKHKKSKGTLWFTYVYIPVDLFFKSHLHKTFNLSRYYLLHSCIKKNDQFIKWNLTLHASWKMINFTKWKLTWNAKALMISIFEKWIWVLVGPWLWNFIVRRVKFSTSFHPNEHLKRTRLYLLKQLDWELAKGTFY